MQSTRGPPSLRKQLRLLWQPSHHESLLQVLQRFPSQGAAASFHQIYRRILSCRVRIISSPFISSDRICLLSGGPGPSRRRRRCSEPGDGGGGGRSATKGGDKTATKPVLGLQETGRADRVRVQVRYNFLRGP